MNILKNCQIRKNYKYLNKYYIFNTIKLLFKKIKKIRQSAVSWSVRKDYCQQILSIHPPLSDKGGEGGCDGWENVATDCLCVCLCVCVCVCVSVSVAALFINHNVSFLWHPTLSLPLSSSAPVLILSQCSVIFSLSRKLFLYYPLQHRSSINTLLITCCSELLLKMCVSVFKGWFDVMLWL